MRTIPLTKSYSTIVDDEAYPWLQRHAWHTLGTRPEKVYAVHTDWSSGRWHHILMHREIMAVELAFSPLGTQVDHINRNPLDNRRCNLRLATCEENTRNGNKRRTNTSGYTGVYWDSRRKKWCAQIVVNRKHLHIGYYDIDKEAARAYDRMAREYHGQFAKQNFPAEGEEASK